MADATIADDNADADPVTALDNWLVEATTAEETDCTDVATAAMEVAREDDDDTTAEESWVMVIKSDEDSVEDVDVMEVESCVVAPITAKLRPCCTLAVMPACAVAADAMLWLRMLVVCSMVAPISADAELTAAAVAVLAPVDMVCCAAAKRANRPPLGGATVGYRLLETAVRAADSDRQSLGWGEMMFSIWVTDPEGDVMVAVTFASLLAPEG